MGPQPRSKLGDDVSFQPREMSTNLFFVKKVVIKSNYKNIIQREIHLPYSDDTLSFMLRVKVRLDFKNDGKRRWKKTKPTQGQSL